MVLALTRKWFSANAGEVEKAKSAKAMYLMETIVDGCFVCALGLVGEFNL
jgi:hypothetical protein